MLFFMSLFNLISVSSLLTFTRGKSLNTEKAEFCRTFFSNYYGTGNISSLFWLVEQQLSVAAGGNALIRL